MTLQHLIQNYVAFNVWANTRVVNWLQQQSEDLLTQTVPSSFPSLRNTLEHNYMTEKFWLAILKGEKVVFRDAIDGDISTVFSTVLAQSEAFYAYVIALSEEELFENCNLDMPWSKTNLPRFEYIQHCMNHSTYHRGQLITIAHNLGIKNAPSTDYHFYNSKKPSL